MPRTTRGSAERRDSQHTCVGARLTPAQGAILQVMDRSAVEAERQRQRIRERAKAAREQALAARMERSRIARAALESATRAVDNGIGSSVVMAAWVEGLSPLVGRSPFIEEAKGRMAEEYGISRGEAFRLMVSLSNNSNRRLRDVAERLLDRRVHPKPSTQDEHAFGTGLINELLLKCLGKPLLPRGHDGAAERVPGGRGGGRFDSP